jgi:hypothetical protein
LLKTAYERHSLATDIVFSRLTNRALEHNPFSCPGSGVLKWLHIMAVNTRNSLKITLKLGKGKKLPPAYLIKHKATNTCWRMEVLNAR